MMQKIRYLLLFTIILSSLAAFVACGETTTTTPAQTQTPTSTSTPTQTSVPSNTVIATPLSTPTPTPTGPQQYGGVLKIIGSPGISNLGYPGKPFTPGGQLYTRPVTEYFLNRASDGSGEPTPELAESWEWSDDHLQLTLHLRKGVKFHDGTPFNAEAAKFNIELHKNGVRTEMEPVTAIDIIDDYTVKLTLSRYDSSFLHGLMAVSGQVVSPQAIKTMGDDAMFHPVGTGPFKFDSYKRDVSLKYVRNDDYWQKGKPYLDSIEFIFIADAVTKVAVLKVGDAHIMRDVTVNEVADLERVGFYITVAPGSVNGLAMDSNHPDSHFYDVNVRRAIAYAIDNEAIAKALGHGYYEACNQWFPKNNVAYNPDVVGYPYNPTKAKQLLAEAGYPNGFETELYFESNSTDQRNTYTAVQGYLAEVGINVKLKATDRGAFRAMVADGWNDCIVHMYTAVALGVDPVSTLKTKMVSVGSRYSPGSLWIPEDYDALYFEAAGAKDFKTYKEIFMQIGKLMIDEYCMAVPIVAPSSFQAMAPGVHCDIGQYGLAEWRPEDSWIEK